MLAGSKAIFYLVMFTRFRQIRSFYEQFILNNFVIIIKNNNLKAVCSKIFFCRYISLTGGVA